MAIVWTRIDDRLIHGQVASSWLSHVKAEQVIIADDEVANNDVQKNILKMAAPGVKVNIFSVEHFSEIYKTKPINRRTLLLLPNTLAARQLVENGVALEQLNFGGMRSRDDRKSYRHDLCFTPTEEEALEFLLAAGVKVDYQMAAYDTPEPLAPLLASLK